MDPEVLETLVPDVAGVDDLNVDSLTEDNYASGSESVYDATITSLDDDEFRSATASSFYEDSELSAILGNESGSIDNDDLQEQSDSDEELEPGDIPVSYENAGILNNAYKSQILEMLDQLRSALIKNRNRQEEINRDIDEIQSRRAEKNTEGSGSNCLRKAMIFGVPYFKDISGFGPPPNNDTRKKRAQNEMNHYMMNPKPWSDKDKEKCFAAIREEAIQLKLKKVIKEETEIITKFRFLNPVDDKEEREEKLKRLRELKHEEDRVKALPDEELFDDCFEDYDWMKISAQCFDAVIPPESCKLMWKNMLNPSINKQKWSKDEDAKLVELILQSKKIKDWDLIAAELDNDRTPFQCFHRYVQRHKKNLTTSHWTIKEDKRLVELVEKCRVNNYIPWPKVAYYMHNRTKEQCYQRWSLSARNGIRRGHFLESEDFVLIVATKIYPFKWAKIAEAMPHRGPSQIHSRFNAFLRADFTRWKLADDLKLLELVKIQGSNKWKEVAAELKARKNRSQCRRRFFFIWKKYNDIEDFNLGQLDYNQEAGIQIKRQQKTLANLEKKIRERFQNAGRDRKMALEVEDKMRTVETIHALFDELSVSVDEIKSFLGDLCNEIPREDSYWYDIPKRNQLSNRMLGLPPKPRVLKMAVKRDSDGNLVREFKKPPGRPPKHVTLQKRKEEEAKNARLDKAMEKYFAPSHAWNIGGRPRYSWTGKELSKMGTVMCQYAHILNIKPDPEKPITQLSSKIFDLNIQMLKVFENEGPETITTQPIKRAKTFQVALPPPPAIRLVPVNPVEVLQPMKPVIRTYSRKSKAVTVQQNSEPVQQPQQPPQSQPPRQYFKIENPDQARQQIEEYHMNRNQLIQSQQVPVNQEQVEQQQQQPQFVVVNPRQQPQPHLGGLIPPNRSTLVGMKGFLMCLKRLKKNSGEIVSLTDPKISVHYGMRETVVSPMTQAEIKAKEEARKNSRNRQTENGEPVPGPSRQNQDDPGTSRDESRLSPEEADRLLKERFLSLFFWPGHLSLNKPRQIENIFDDDTLTAQDPFDASEVISEAQTNAANSPRIVVRKAAKKTPAHEVSTVRRSGAVSEGACGSSSSTASAPPPQKKRILAQARLQTSRDT